MADQPFLTDVKTLRERARQHIEEGAVTQGYKADRDTVVRLLNDALATEIVCYLRYKYHYYMASGVASSGAAAEFLEHANEEREHADWLAERIIELDGKPDLNPAGLVSRSHAEYIEGDTLIDMIKEDLIAERIAIDSYREMAEYFGEKDPTSRRLMEKILEVEEEHAADMQSLLEQHGTIQQSSQPSAG
jgi:bacterioferritin